MNSPAGSTYGFIRMDERYKKLERTIKMMQLKQDEQKSTDNSVPDTGPNVSSINGDAFDTSCVYSSKLGSEVVSSSTNMKNIISNNIKMHKNINNIATSSVKVCTIDDAEARAIMPPPKICGITGHSSRRNSLAQTNFHKTDHRNFSPSNPSIISAITCSKTVQNRSTTKYDENNPNTHYDMVNVGEPDRIFERWKVTLNEKGQLIIKGTLKGCEKTVRSKPVIRRINAVTVQSCFNHIYELRGRISDDQSELPDYIRGKFYNGFPDDWENAYQLWRSYVAGGCKPTFRWPTPVADSDDDLKSDITELTFREEERYVRSHDDSYKSKSNESEFFLPVKTSTDKSIMKTLRPSSRKKAEIENLSLTKNTSNICNRSIEKPQSFSDDRNKIINSVFNIIDDQKINDSAAINNNIDEDISSAVSKILTSKNFSIEYIDKIIEMFNCYKYVIMSKPQTANTSLNSKAENHIASAEEIVPKETIHKDLNYAYDNITNKYTPNNLNASQSTKSHRYHLRNTSKYSQEFSSAKNTRQARRKLLKRDYDSSDASGSEFEVVQKNTSPRKMFRSYDNGRIIRRTQIVDSKRSRDYSSIKNNNTPRRVMDDDSDDDFVPRKAIQYMQQGTYQLNDRILLVDMKKRMPKNSHISSNTEYQSMPRKLSSEIQETNLLRSHQNQLSSKNFRMRVTESQSTITGLLGNYDASVSISKDDRMQESQSKLIETNKASNKFTAETNSNSELRQVNINHHYDSTISLTEDEKNDVGKKNQKRKVTKHVLQESNTQCFPRILKRNLMQKNQHRQEQDKDNYSKESHLFPPSRERTEVLNVLADSPNDNKENKSTGDNVGHHLNHHHIDNNHMSISVEEKSKHNSEQSSPKKNKKPTIISVEKSSVDIKSLLSHKLSHQTDKNNKSPKNLKTSNASEIDKRHVNSMKSLKKSEHEKPTPLDLSSKSIKPEITTQSKLLSVKLETIKKVPNDKNSEVMKKNTMDKNIIFGSESNPKPLMNWVPKVIKKSDATYGLLFEGKLLNEAGHVVNKKFTTAFIVKRVSLKIIETENHKFYELVGDLTDTKYTVPKELLKFCINGCPAKIAQFCEKWKNKVMKNLGVSNDALNSSIDIMNIPQSSRGRRILPPLCYWTGERITMKDNQIVYSAGNSRDPLNYSSYDNSKKDTPQLSRSRASIVKDTTTATKKNSNMDKQERDRSKNAEYKERTDKKANKESINAPVKKEKVLRHSRLLNERKRVTNRRPEINFSSEDDTPIPKRRRRGNTDDQEKKSTSEHINKTDERNIDVIKNEDINVRNTRRRSRRNQNNNNINVENNSNGITLKYYKQVPCRKDEFSDYQSSV